eukprot:gene24432-6356_t
MASTGWLLEGPGLPPSRSGEGRWMPYKAEYNGIIACALATKRDGRVVLPDHPDGNVEILFGAMLQDPILAIPAAKAATGMPQPTSGDAADATTPNITAASKHSKSTRRSRGT